MASKKKAAGKKNETDSEGLSKEQDEIARYVRFNCSTNATMFQGNEVHYFSGSKAVDTLFESKYGTKAKENPKFASRASAVNYMQTLMDMRLFFRAKKLVPKKKEDKKDKSQGDSKLKKKDDKEDSVTETEAEEKEKKDEKEKPKKEDDEKKKKKVKLEVYDIQVFNDDKDVYVWVFDPTPLYKKVIGLLMVLGTIVGCLFPLWPMWLRQGIYYLSLVGIGAFGMVIVVAILRTILFGVIWLATMGQHKLWILPNLTEDCGFFESFKPYYTYEYCPKDQKSVKKDEKKTKKKEKDSDDEKEPEVEVKAEDATSKKSEGSASESISGESEVDSASEDLSAPPSPSEGTVKKRRVRRDDGFVVVDK